MPSRIARALFPVPRVSGPVGDTLWRSSDLEGLDFAGCAPTTALISEMFMLNVPETLEHAGRLTPTSESIDAALGLNSPVSYRRGVAQNPAASDAVLSVLSSDPDKSVADLAAQQVEDRKNLRQQFQTDPAAAASAALSARQFHVIASEFSAHSHHVIAALATSDMHASALLALAAFSSDLHDQLLLEWVSGLEVPMTAYAAKWVCASALRAETLLGGASTQVLRRKATPMARSVLEAHGVLPRMSTPSAVPLDGLLIGLTPSEMAAMVIGSEAPVSGEIAHRAILAAPPSLVANFLRGACLRRPDSDMVLSLVESASSDQRQSWAEALSASGLTGEDISFLPWAGPLLLVGSLDFVESLGVQAAAELNAVFEQKLASNEAAWEFACVLSEEWTGTIAGLLDSAVAMESAA